MTRSKRRKMQRMGASAVTRKVAHRVPLASAALLTARSRRSARIA